jgi:Tropinone reductase 1
MPLWYYAALLLLLLPVASASSGWTFTPETTAVVTGGTKGIGRAIVEELIFHGCRVLTCSRNQEELDELLNEYPSCYGVVANVATPEGRATLLNAIREYLGPTLDILINNVGTNVRKASIDYEDDDVQHIWNTNFHSMFALTTACHSLLKRSSGGTTSSVVNIGSVAGVMCVKSGIRVNCVTPWYINTQLAKQVLKNEDYKRYHVSVCCALENSFPHHVVACHRTVLERTPLGRVGEPEEVAALVTFLCLPGKSCG